MKEILSVKDWLKERSGKTQFKVINSLNGKVYIVKRNSDKLEFALGVNELTSERIIKFHEDLIHVTISALVMENAESDPVRKEAVFEINWLGKYHSLGYKK